MASKQKANQFLEVSRIKEHYSSLIDNSLTFFIAKAESEGSPLADDLKQLKDGYVQDFESVQDLAAEVISEVFSDDELDELIVLHSNPSLDKLRGLTPEIMSRILERFSKQSNGGQA